MTHRDQLPDRKPGELTLEEAAVRAGTTLRIITEHVRRGRLATRKVKGARVSARVVHERDLSTIITLEHPLPLSATIRIGRLEIQQRRSSLTLAEVGFLLQVSVAEVANEIAEQGRLTHAPADPSRVPVGVIRRLPEIAGDQLALLFLARIAEGSLTVPEPASETSMPESHLVALERLK